MTRAQLNLALLALAAGLASAAYLAQKPEPKGPPLLALSPEAIQRVALEHPGKPLIRLEKAPDGEWRLLEPVQAAVSAFEINGVLGLAGLETRKTLPAPVDNAAELGLDPPAYRVTFNDQTLALGGIESLNYRRYVQRPDGSVALVDDPPGAALDADYSDLVARELLPPGAELQKLELPGLTLLKDAAGWRAEGRPEADRARIEALVGEWRKAQAMWNGEAGAVAADAPEARITLADGRVLAFRIAERDPQLALVSEALGVRYTLSKALDAGLFSLEPPPAASADPAEAAAGAEAAADVPADAASAASH